MVLQDVFLVFLPRNSKNISAQEHYIPTMNPLSNWPLHAAPHSPLPQWAPGNPGPVPHSQLRNQAQATFTLFCGWQSVPVGQCPGAIAYKDFPITSEGAVAVERSQVVIHQVPAAPFNCVQSHRLALLPELLRDPQQYQSCPSSLPFLCGSPCSTPLATVITQGAP